MPANAKRRASREKAGKAADYAARQLDKMRRPSGRRPHLAKSTPLGLAVVSAVAVNRRANRDRPVHLHAPTSAKKIRRALRAGL